MATAEFWRHLSFEQMNQQQWESLCDGCGKCCLHKLEDEDSGDIFYTAVACQYLTDDCRCRCYGERTRKVEACLQLRPENLATVNWLPSTCAYRLLAEGKPLPQWHPLISGDSQSVHRAGASVKGRVIDELAVNIDDLEDYIVDWP